MIGSKPPVRSVGVTCSVLIAIEGTKMLSATGPWKPGLSLPPTSPKPLSTSGWSGELLSLTAAEQSKAPFNASVMPDGTIHLG